MKNIRQWIFYLRSSATFHDQSNVTATDVVESLQALRHSSYWRRLYDHIIRIEANSPYCVVITLNSSDPNLPCLLSRAEASILPRNNICQPETSYSPIGSGPFLVEVNSERVLRLARNNQFCGQCALIERIEIWIHPEWAQDKKCAENFFFLDGDEESYKVSTNNIGYFFVLLNHRELQTDSVRESFVRLFQSENTTSVKFPFPVSFSYENNNDNRDFARKLMATESMVKHKLIGRQVSYGHTLVNQDFAIGGVRLEGERVMSLFAFFKLYPFWSENLTWELHEYLLETLQMIRSSRSFTEQSALLDKLIKVLYESKRIRGC